MNVRSVSGMINAPPDLIPNFTNVPVTMRDTWDAPVNVMMRGMLAQAMLTPLEEKRQGLRRCIVHQTQALLHGQISRRVHESKTTQI